MLPGAVPSSKITSPSSSSMYSSSGFRLGRLAVAGGGVCTVQHLQFTGCFAGEGASCQPQR